QFGGGRRLLQRAFVLALGLDFVFAAAGLALVCLVHARRKRNALGANGDVVFGLQRGGVGVDQAAGLDMDVLPTELVADRGDGFPGAGGLFAVLPDAVCVLLFPGLTVVAF